MVKDMPNKFSEVTPEIKELAKKCNKKIDEELFAKYDGVTFRDQFSYNLFSCLKNVRWAPDIVFNYPVKRGKYKEKKRILFSPERDCR